MNRWNEPIKVAFEKVKQFVKKQEERILLWSVIFGLLCFLFASSLNPTDWPKISSLFVNLGSASIVSGIIYWLMSLTRNKLEKTIKGAIVDLGNKLNIFSNEINSNLASASFLGDAKECGIVRIFKSRRDMPTELTSQLITEFKEMPENSSITIMAISLRDLILGDERKRIIPVINDIITNKDIKIRLLLLDPTSKSAMDRAMVEEPEVFKRDGYSNSSLFKDSMNVADFLTYPRLTVVPQKNKKKVFSNIEIRYYPYDPTTFIISTDRHTFVEQYHRGGDERIRITLKEKDGIGFVECFAGFTPVLMLDNKKSFSQLLMSHVDNIWKSKNVINKRLTKAIYKDFVSFREKLVLHERKLRCCEPDEAAALFKDDFSYFLNRRQKELEMDFGDDRRTTIH